jgi:MEMO1 family protein
MPLVFAAITPHPPIIIPGVGSRDDLIKFQKTTRAMEKLTQCWQEAKPDTTLIISPHAPIDDKHFAINTSAQVQASWTEFGAATPPYRLSVDSDLVDILQSTTGLQNLLIPYQSRELDHGSSVPLHYILRRNKNCPIISLSFSNLSLEKHFAYGQKLAEVIAKSDKKIAVIASGDLSHALTPKAPAGFSAQGKIFDDYLVKSVRENNLSKLVNTDKTLLAAAAECGLRSFVILAGILENSEYSARIFSYEAPWGVGYLVANFKIHHHV